MTAPKTDSVHSVSPSGEAVRAALLPCPFCGGEAKLSSRASAAAEYGAFIAFAVCYCGSYSATAHQHAKGDTPDEARVNVTAKWNNRAVDVAALRASHDALLDALKELLALPGAIQELRYLDNGIGTATPAAAWLRARTAVRASPLSSADLALAESFAGPKFPMKEGGGS